MTKLTITEASHATGLARTTLYRRAAKGQLQIEKNKAGETVVDSRELERVFGHRRGQRSNGATGNGATRDETQQLIELLQMQFSELQGDLKTLLHRIDRREEESRAVERRLLSLLEHQMPEPRAPATGPLPDGRLRNADIAKTHGVRLKRTHGIVPALDADSFDEVRRVVEKTTDIDGVVAYKIGLTSVLRLGLAETVTALRSVTDLPLIYDHQKAGADIPDMAAKFVALCKRAGVDGLILFPTAGPRAVSSFVGEAQKRKLLPIVGGELPLPEYLARGGGYISDDALFRIIDRSLDMHADHFVVPATDLEKVRRLARLLNRRLEVPFLFLPGIGALGGSIEQAFAAAPGCRVYAVVGRAVYAASDPAEAARQLSGEALRFA